MDLATLDCKRVSETCTDQQIGMLSQSLTSTNQRITILDSSLKSYTDDKVEFQDEKKHRLGNDHQNQEITLRNNSTNGLSVDSDGV